MRHRRKGRVLGRSPSHRKAMLSNMVCSLILTERDDLYYEGLTQPDGKTAVNPPARKGRIVTTLHKAKEVRPLVEKCITIAKNALPHEEKAAEFAGAAVLATVLVITLLALPLMGRALNGMLKAQTALCTLAVAVGGVLYSGAWSRDGWIGLGVFLTLASIVIGRRLGRQLDPDS